MKTRRLTALALTLVATMWGVTADAQVPPHSPGTICFTKAFWCWAQPPGPPGSGCSCPTPAGWVPGVRG